MGADGNATPAELNEQAALRTRRHAAGIDPREAQIGLALSGGGIRSATFCLGLLRSLAGNGVLRHVDYLSTVSGGGYAGAAFGRLFHAHDTPQEVEQGLKEDHSLWHWWLRNNGRYLTPAGAGDLLTALSGQLRAFLVTQFEVLVMALALSCIVIVPHLIVSDSLAPGADPWLPGSAWWWLILLPAVFGLVIAYAYWFLDRQHGLGLLTTLLALAVGGYACTVFGRAYPDVLAANSGAADGLGTVTFMMWLVGVVGAGLVLSPVGWLIARIMNFFAPADRNRLFLTRALTWAMSAMVALLVLGALDLSSWYLSSLFDQQLSGNVQLSVGIGTVTAIIAVARLALPLLQSRHPSIKRLPVAQIANFAGLLIVLIVAALWLTLLQLFVFYASNRLTHLPGAWWRWGGVLVITCLFLLFNGWILEQLNRSSLHYFYRSRLARTFVSTGNDRDSHAAPGIPETYRFPGAILASRSRDGIGDVSKVTRLLEGDDVLLTRYVPHKYGGPIHLINCCINQTTDDRTGNYNADRKGVYLTISALGMETGTHGPEPLDTRWRDSTLAEWIAISGAAVGTGMGSLTKPGLASLIFLSGMRLGFWLPGARRRGRGPGFLPKYAAMLGEMFARFPGLQSNRWYVSDGGHFDNTGVYALLKRRLPLIVLADCGADPGYLFADVENLIRKARIDYDARIEFIEPASIHRMAGAMARHFGTPDSIQPGTGDEFLLLAKITYADAPPGALLVIKPRCTKKMPLDVAGYADRNTSFPQQSTANQFFSEEEWESYNHLGSTLGTRIDANLLAQLPLWVRAGRVAGTNTDELSQEKPKLTRAQRIAATVGTSIGIGAILTGLLTAWQVWDGHKSDNAGQPTAFATESRALLGDLSRRKGDQASYDRDLSARLGLFVDAIDVSGLSKEEATVLTNILDLAQDLCDAPKNTFAQCKEELRSINARMQRRSSWEVAMDAYAHFDPSPAVSGTAASAGLPAALAQATSVGEPAAGAEAVELTPAGAVPAPAASTGSLDQLRADAKNAQRLLASLQDARRRAAQASAMASASEQYSVKQAAPDELQEAISRAQAQASASQLALAQAEREVQVQEAQQRQAQQAQAEQRSAEQTKRSKWSDGLSPEEQERRRAQWRKLTSDALDVCRTKASRTFMLYTQIYDETQRDGAASLLKRARAAGITTPGVENVTATAARKGTAVPGRWRQPTLLYRTEGAACAQALVAFLNYPRPANAPDAVQAVLMPQQLGGPVNVMELWLPAAPSP